MTTKKTGIGHWAFGIGFLLFSMAASTFVSADTVDLAPPYPTRVDLLTCTYTVPEPGVFRFEFFKNDDINQLLFEKETDKRTVAFRPQGLVNRDKVRCVVSLRFRGDYVELGSDIVTVGAYQCNDLNDNDDDTRVDMQDPGCRMPKDISEAEPACSDDIDNDHDGLIDLTDPGCMRDPLKNEETFANGPACDNGIDDDGDRLMDMRSPGCDNPADNSERVDYLVFCQQNPRNLYCRGLGLNDLVILCNAAQQPVCQEQNMRQAEGFCRQMPNEDICAGVQNIPARCEGRRDDLLCNEVQAQMIACRDNRECLEITNDDEEVLCRLRAYQFCPQQEAVEQPAEGAVGQEQLAPAQQPQQPQPRVEAEDERREDVREAIEDAYLDVRERQQRLEEERRRAAVAVPPVPAAPSPVPFPRSPTSNSRPDIIAQKERIPLTFGKKAAGLPTAGVIAAGAGIIALLGWVVYRLARSKQPSPPMQPQPPTPPPTQQSFVVKTMKIRRQRAPNARNAWKRKK